MNSEHFDSYSNFNKEELENSCKIIQKQFRKSRNTIKKVNDKLNITYNNIFSIMKRINKNFVLSLISQYDYNSELLKLDNQLNNLKKLPRPFKLKDKLEYNVETLFYIIDNINENLFDIAMKSGIDNIFDIIYIRYDNNVRNILNEISNEEKNLIHFYNNVFIPLTVDIYKKDELEELKENKSIIPYEGKQKINKKQYDIRNIHLIKKSKCFPMYKKSKTFIEKILGARLYLPIKSKKYDIDDILVFDGYFQEDPLNISRVGGILEKKNNDLLNKLKFLDTNKYFKSAFIQQISIRDFILNDNEELLEMCNNAYIELQNLKKKTISQLVKEFLLSDITKQRNTLTLFLLMKDEVDTQYLAYLMYDMITNESYLLKPQPLAEQVFNSLHWSVQKLFKVAIKKINKNTNKLLNFNEEEISYEKRIFLMKTSDYVKSKAMEKYKEYSKSGEGFCEMYAIY
jgi:hypothetical protein